MRESRGRWGAKSFNPRINDQAVFFFVTERIIIPIPSARRTFDPFFGRAHSPPHLLQVSVRPAGVCTGARGARSKVVVQEGGEGKKEHNPFVTKFSNHLFMFDIPA